MNETCFPSLTKCQSDSLCSPSSGFAEHQFPLITSFFVLHLMMQPGLEGSYHVYCSSRMTDTRTESVSLPFISFPFPSHVISALVQAGIRAASRRFLRPPPPSHTALCVPMSKLVFLHPHHSPFHDDSSAGCAPGGPVFPTGCISELTRIMYEHCSWHMLRALNGLPHLLLTSSQGGGSWW